MDGGKRALTSMSQLICLGLGYSAEHYVAAFGLKFDRIVGTMRSEERAAVLNADDDGRLQALVFDGRSASPKLQQAIVAADAALISIPQDAEFSIYLSRLLPLKRLIGPTRYSPLVFCHLDCFV